MAVVRPRNRRFDHERASGQESTTLGEATGTTSKQQAQERKAEKNDGETDKLDHAEEEP